MHGCAISSKAPLPYAMSKTRQWQETLPEAARARAEATGDAGRRWMGELEATVSVLATRWNVLVGDALPGGSESLVLAVRRENGADAHPKATAVLVHADAHEHNLLVVPGRDCEPGAPCKFVDPDGLLAEPACDLAVPMRGWSTELRDAPMHLGRERCAYLAERCEVGERAIWQWGFMERVSTGLHLLELGIEEEAREMLEVADHWSRQPGP